MIRLEDQAPEEGTFHLVLEFEDEDGAGNAPTAIAWTLCDPDGNVMNGRTAVAVAAPATSNTVTLAGTDLSIVSGQTNERLFLVEWTYNSTYGVGLVTNEEARFTIKNRKKVV